jgi:phospholipid-transporting ATPase
MLTGDKMETAENIAKSCRLIQPDFEMIKFAYKDYPEQDKEESLITSVD